MWQGARVQPERLRRVEKTRPQSRRCAVSLSAGAEIQPFVRAKQAQRVSRPRPSRRLGRIFNLTDFQPEAKKRLPRAIYAYVASGSEDETALHTNRNAFLDYRLVPRVLRGVTQHDQSRVLFGRRYAAPFGIAPMGGASVVTYGGDRHMAQAAQATGIPFVLSGNSITPMEKLARVCPGAWFASYQPPDDRDVEAMVRRVADAGFAVFAMTVDVPTESNREQERRADFSQPIRPHPGLLLQGLRHPGWVLSSALPTLLTHGIPHVANLTAEGGPSLFSGRMKQVSKHAALSWHHVELARRLWRGPMVLKGILSHEDARIARECGVDGIVVSNHGGRQLDAAATPLQVLPGIRAAAKGMAVLIDGGFRRGTDILTALALGADFVLIGRPFLYAAAAGGTAGVLHAIGLLSKELDRDLTLMGLRDLGELGPDSVLDVRLSAAANTATSR
jgi:L-lactate dehydrogenase (cytochrome)